MKIASRPFAEIRKRLLARRHQLEADLGRYETWQLATLGYGNALVDDAAVAFDQSTQLTLQNRLVQHLKRIDQALARIDAGTYGICECCNKTIQTERLEALPDTRLCVACQRLQERSPLGRLAVLPEATNPALF